MSFSQTLINRIYHRSLMQTEISQPEGKRIMPETRFTSFPALSVDPRVTSFPALSVYPRVGISRSASESYVCLFFLHMTLKIIICHSSFLSYFDILRRKMTFSERYSGVFRGGDKVMSLLKFRVQT